MTAFHTTGIPNVTTYMAVPQRAAKVLSGVGRALPFLMRPEKVRTILMELVEKRVARGPDEAARQAGRSYVWARAKNARGESAEAWLETLEGYLFTALSGIRAVEKTLQLKPHGALTPARAFGADFVLELPETRRLDALV